VFDDVGQISRTSCFGRPPQYAPAPCKLTFDLLTLKVVFELHVACATFVPVLVFPGLSVLDLGRMYATDRQTRQTRIIAYVPYPMGGGIIIYSAMSTGLRERVSLQEPVA